MAREYGLTVVIGALLLAGGVFGLARGETAAPLQVGFYNGKCKGNADVEAIVRTVVTLSFLKDPTITPALVRMQFHDCFVNVSILAPHTPTKLIFHYIFIKFIDKIL